MISALEKLLIYYHFIIVDTQVMNHATRLKKSPQTFRRLTGIGPDEFTNLLSKLAPLYEAWNAERLSKKTRQRKVVAGGKFHLDMEDRLLMLLIYYRCYITHAFLGFLFQIDDSNVGRNINPLMPLLAGIFRIPEKRIKVNREEVEVLFFDGTEQRIQRPQSNQKQSYSGKKKAHTRKVQVVVSKRKDPSGITKTKIEAVSKSFPGKVHDKRIYDESRMYNPPGIRRRADSGYQGAATMEVPHKKLPKKELTSEQKEETRLHSSDRICVEHGIGKMKIWRILSDRFRNQPSIHGLIFKNIAGLSNLMFA